MSRNYYLGLDMGTSSLGWAVTDPEYHLLRAKGKDLWGVRLFPEAESSAGRRTQRISRRRLQRMVTLTMLLLAMTVQLHSSMLVSLLKTKFSSLYHKK